MTLLEQLSQHLQRPVNEETRQRARLHLLDWLACVAGARGSRLVDHGLQGEASSAILLGNVLEMDDVHRVGRLHPGPVVWGTVIPLAEFAQARSPEQYSFTAKLDAAVRGYEAMIAIGATLDDKHYAFFHPTATAGLFGAAAAASSLKMNRPDEVASALALVGSVAGGLWQTRHTFNDGKQWHVAHAVRTGIDAASSAAIGMYGPLDILEGSQGLYAATCREPKPMVLGDDWRIFEVSFKPWAACRHAHPVIDCALELRAAGKLEPPYTVETYADAITFCDRPDPKTEAEAKFSLQHAVAVIADGRSAEPADFMPEAIAALAPLRAQVTVREAPDITARYPAHFGARVNGLELIDTRGDPERPVSLDTIIAKTRTLVAWGGLDATEADRAVELALRGNDAGEISNMLEDWLS